MKSKIKNCIFIMFIIFFMIFLLPEKAFASYQRLNELDFQIDVKENGDIQITEFWNVELEDTNTLFKTFSKDNKIVDVVVKEITDEKEIDFSKKNEYQYNVDENCYQAIDNPDGNFEIAWGVNSSYDEERKFKISYTVLNYVTKYNDCAEIYWKLIGDDFEIYCDEITGTINLPNGIEDIEELRVWAHGPLNGTITKENANKVVFRVEELPTNTFFEIRLTTPTNIFSKVEKIVNENGLTTILEEEKIFAEEANLAREEYARKQEQYKKIATVVLSIGIVIGAVTVFINSKKIFTEKKIKPEIEYEYFRDIPDESATPSEASLIYYKSENEIYSNFGKIFSATLLNLSLKGWITFGKNDDKKDSVLITLNENGKEELKEDEQEIYNYLASLFEKGSTFSIKEFQKKAQKKVKTFAKLGENIVKYIKEKNEEKEIFNPKLKRKADKYIIELSLYLLAIFFSFAAIDYNVDLMGTFIIIGLINIIISIPLICRYNGFTQKGVNEAAKWKGLVEFMKDFSLIDKREVPELILWEKYLVYATAFGVADKVIKQLKVYFPEMVDEEYLNSHCTYMHFVSDTNMNFITNMNSSIGSVVNYTSASGAGGGFSSGGGGASGSVGGGGR